MKRAEAQLYYDGSKSKTTASNGKFNSLITIVYSIAFILFVVWLSVTLGGNSTGFLVLSNANLDKNLSSDYNTSKLNLENPIIVKPVCGDNTCSNTENPNNCPADCKSVCGDNVCNGYENLKNCSKDCKPVCGDRTCSRSESCDSCSLDCGECEVSFCGDNTCDSNETCSNCSKDCGVCTSVINLSNPRRPHTGGGHDDPKCGDNKCNGNDNASNCPQDCSAVLGDGYCTHDENVTNAYVDCRSATVMELKLNEGEGLELDDSSSRGNNCLIESKLPFSGDDDLGSWYFGRGIVSTYKNYNYILCDNDSKNEMNEEFTISFWFNSNAEEKILLFKKLKNLKLDLYNGIEVYQLADGKISVKLSDALDVLEFNTDNYAKKYNDIKWHSLVLKLDYVDRGQIIYLMIDNEIIYEINSWDRTDESSIFNKIDLENDAPIYFADGEVYKSQVYGAINLYNIILSTEELTSLYNSGKISYNGYLEFPPVEPELLTIKKNDLSQTSSKVISSSSKQSKKKHSSNNSNSTKSKTIPTTKPENSLTSSKKGN
ncbi:MAG: hypothetical protein V1824_00085 [archaeon]